MRLSFGPDARAARRAPWSMTPARSSPSWGRADRASRRCCTAWPASSCPTRARSSSTGMRVDTLGEHERSALRRDRFGFVFQFGQLVPELTARGERRPAAAARRRPPRGRAPARRAAWFERLDLDGLEGRRSGELSGGQAQRVALARALVAAAGGAVRRRADRRRSTRSPASTSWTCSPAPPAIRARPSSWSPTSRGWPPTPTARSWCATARSPHCSLDRPPRDPPRPAADAQRRARGARPARPHRRRRRARRRHAADHAGRRSTRSTRRTRGTPGWKPIPARIRHAVEPAVRPGVVATSPPTSSTATSSGGSMSRPPDRTRRSHRDLARCPVPASTTHRRR